jgi:heme-degrading monooxygenase HmoA
MIARIWNGKTDMVHYETYSAFLEQVAIPDYEKTTGFSGLVFLRNLDDHHAHFKLITYWDSIQSIKDFAGSDYKKAKYYPEDKNFLLHFEEEATHYEVFAKSKH